MAVNTEVITDGTPPVTPTAPSDGSSPPPVIDQPTNEWRDWLLQQDEELQNDTILQPFKSFKEVAKSLSETKRWADGRVKLPDENTPPEEVNKFYSRLGVPEKPEEYQFSKVELPEGTAIDLSLLDAFKPVFHEAKLTRAQADKIQATYLKTVGEQQIKLVQEYQAEVAQKIEVLKNRWGDSYDAKLNQAIRFFNAAAPVSVRAYVEKNGLGNDADFIEWMYDQSVKTGEDTFRPGTPSDSEFKTLDDEIKAINNQIGSAEFRALGERDPKRLEIIKKREELYSKRYPQSE